MHTHRIPPAFRCSGHFVPVVSVIGLLGNLLTNGGPSLSIKTNHWNHSQILKENVADMKRWATKWRFKEEWGKVQLAHVNYSTVTFTCTARQPRALGQQSDLTKSKSCISPKRRKEKEFRLMAETRRLSRRCDAISNFVWRHLSVEKLEWSIHARKSQTKSDCSGTQPFNIVLSMSLLFSYMGETLRIEGKRQSFSAQLFPFLKLFFEGKAGVAHVGSSIKGFYEAKKEFFFFFCFVVCPAPVAITNTQLKIKRIIAKHLMNYRHHLYCLFFFSFFWVWEGGKRDLMSCVGFCVSCSHTQTQTQWRWTSSCELMIIIKIMMMRFDRRFNRRCLIIHRPRCVNEVLLRASRKISTQQTFERRRERKRGKKGELDAMKNAMMVVNTYRPFQSYRNGTGFVCLRVHSRPQTSFKHSPRNGSERPTSQRNGNISIFLYFPNKSREINEKSTENSTAPVCVYALGGQRTRTLFLRFDRNALMEVAH